MWWQYKLEPDQVLDVTVSPCDYVSVRESFLAKMLKDGRIVIPKLTLQLLQQEARSLEGQIMEVTLQPI